MKPTIFHMTNITMLRLGRTKPSNFETHYFEGEKYLNPKLLRFVSHRGMGVAILKLFYVYWRTEQMSKCKDVLRRQDSY